MLVRVLEPEVMDTPEEAADYDAMDHAVVNARFCDDVVALLATLASSSATSTSLADGAVLDVGTGTARIPVELAARLPRARFVAIDLAEHMLAIAARHVANAGLDARVRLERVDAKATAYDAGAFSVVVSNSIVHHIPEPARVLEEMWRVLAPGGVLFVRDLARPESRADLGRLVETYASGEPERARVLFEASLEAALTPAEIVAMIAPLGIPPHAVAMTSDRHWTLHTVKPW